MSVKFITRDQLHELLNQEEREGGNYLRWDGYNEFGAQGLLYGTWQDTRTKQTYVVQEVRTVHMGFNSNEEGTVEEFVRIVEREGACKASWGVTGRTKHLMLANELAKSLPQYDWEVDYDMYGCKATKRAESSSDMDTTGGDNTMMNNKTVYTNTRENEQYVLEPSITQGNKQCLISLKNGEHKFVAPSTLKRWYTKTEQPDAMYVTVCAFTGMPIGCYKASNIGNGIIEVLTKAGNFLRFDQNTGLQVNANNPRFANRICWTV